MTPQLRGRVERLVELLIELLDRLDGDPDLEPEFSAADLDALSLVEEPRRWIERAA